MKSSIKRTLLIIIVIVITNVLVLGYSHFKERGIVKITNNTSNILSSVELIYNTGNRTVQLGSIGINKTLKYKIDDSGEDSISIKFDDVNGVLHKEIILGYTMKNMDSVKVKITEDNQGNINIISN